MFHTGYIYIGYRASRTAASTYRLQVIDRNKLDTNRSGIVLFK